MRLLAFLLLLLPTLGSAQGAATLIADRVGIEGKDRLVASGNIEVLYDGTRLSAAQIIYDRATDRLLITGPIFIQGLNGDIITAERATLDPRLENGILRGARLVLDQELQLAAAQITRQGGRYLQLYKSAVTSCHVCGTKAPLWDIRAEEIIHDQKERQLYFKNATFRVRGVPIFWLPRARLPDPTLARATGFLNPDTRNNTQLGTGIKIPYFIRMGDHRDLTLTPYLSSETSTLEARYRQAFLRGDLVVRTAVSEDTLLPETRSYLFADGSFDLGNDFRLKFDIEAASDPAYLLTYGYSSKDRLDSAVSLVRVREDSLFQTSLTYFESLRDDEVNSELPPIVGDLAFERRYANTLNGTLTLGVGGDLLYRYGNAVGDEGRDMLRVGASADWSRTWIGNQGLVTEAQLGMRADAYFVNDDTAYDDVLTRGVPTAALTLRYPLERRTQTVQHLIEPVIDLAWSDVYGDDAPNEDSTRPELDPGNLFALSRFPGEDAVETGLRVAFGGRWTGAWNVGTRARLTFGRIFRQTDDSAFTLTSGLQGTQSDWLLAGQIETPQGLRFEGRALLDDTLEPTSAAAKVEWHDDTVNLSASYIWQEADTDLGRALDVAAFGLDTEVQLSDAWAISFDTRYDVAADRPVKAALGVEWRNECVTVDLSASRRYTTSTTVDPTTDFGLSVTLNGFSAGRTSRGPNAKCDD